MDLPELVAQRRYRHLLILIDQLPSDCRFTQAFLRDPANADQLAREIIEREGEEPSPPSYATWGQTESLLATLIDQVAVLIQTTAAVGGAKPQKVEPHPRPQSIGSDLAKEIREEAAMDLLAKLIPRRN